MGPSAAARVSGLRPLAARPTFPADRPTRQIDHILARGLSGSPVGAAHQLQLSDHRALTVDL
jgi:endonuclease/exonuclease/phosphatase family metal-dependent hydrolase